MTTTSITSGTDFIGKTLIIGSTSLAPRDWSRVFDFNNNSTDTYVFSTGGGSGGSVHWFEYRHASGNQNIWDTISSSLNVYYIYVLSFVSDIQLKFNIYQYDGVSSIIINTVFITINIPNTFLSTLTHFWLGKSAYVWDSYYNGIYSKVALYNGDLFALTEANIVSTLLTLVTSTQTNIINNSTTYTFRSLGTNFLGVVVNILNDNTTTGASVTTSNITLNGTNSTIGGYLNIIGSYRETSDAPTTSNILASIYYATTISSEKYIIIDSQNIELSGNVIMKDGIINNGLLTTNSLIPNVTNSASLGSTSKIWGNAYISDVSVNNNLQVTGNVKIGGILDASNIYTKSQVDASLANVYTKAQIDASFINIYTKSQLDLSFANVYTKSQVDLSFSNVYTKEYIDVSLANVYTKEYVDASFANVYTKEYIDASLANVYTKEYIDASLANVYIKEFSDASFSNVYTKTQFDLSFSNVYTKAFIDASFGNVYTKSQVDASFLNVYTKNVVDASFGNVYTKNYVDISLANVYTKAYVDASFSNVYTKAYVDASFANVYTKALVDASFSNVYIKSRVDASFSNVYTKSQVDLSFANVYTKGQVDTSFLNVYTRSQVDVSFAARRLFDASYNSIAASAGSSTSTALTLTSITSNVVPSSSNTYSLGSTTNYWSNAYIRDLRLSNRAYQEISGDISWNAVNGYYALAKDAYPGLNPLSSGVKAVQTLRNINITGNWYAICWSPKLGIFVAISDSASNNLMTSRDGSNWNIISIPQRTWGATWGTQATLVWSPELEMFVGITSTSTNNIMYSYDGISWSYVTTSSPQMVRTLCWSPQLGIFIVCNNTTSTIYSSKNGTNWTSVSPTTTPFQSNLQNQNVALCWAAELGLFVGVGNYNTWRIIISKNGKDWVLLDVGLTHSLTSVCWSKQLGLLVAVGSGNTHRVLISNNGTVWTLISGITFSLQHVQWCDELALFVAGTNSGTILTSPNGINWSVNNTGGSVRSGCWSPELRLYVALGSNILVTSSLKGRPPTSYNLFDGSFTTIPITITTTVSSTTTGVDYNATPVYTLNHTSLPWEQHRTIARSVVGRDLAVILNATQNATVSTLSGRPTNGSYVIGGSRRLTSTNPAGTTATDFEWVTGAPWSYHNFFPGGSGYGAEPAASNMSVVRFGFYSTTYTMYNAYWDNFGTKDTWYFGGIYGTYPITSSTTTTTTTTTANISANGIDETGKWTFANMAVTSMTAGGSNVASDDRLKHNEVVINNGLAVIDKLCPKFYQKTLTMLDTSYNGDLSGLTWTYEAGLIAQEVLQIPDLHFVVSGGDYYEPVMNYDLSVNDLSANDLSVNDLSINDLSVNDLSVNDLSVNDLSVNEVSKNLIKQPYTLNYNSIFTYGVAAIKELHTKVKAQETNILDQQLNSLITRIETLETSGVPIPNNEA